MSAASVGAWVPAWSAPRPSPAEAHVEIVRVASDDQGTLGELRIDGAAVCYALELPWRDNAPRASCVPSGAYRMRWSRSPRLARWTYEVLDVPGRAGIRVHSGNLAGDAAAGWVTHSLGCPLLGERLGSLRVDRRGQPAQQRAVLLSVATVARVERLLGGRPCRLTVRWASGAAPAAPLLAAAAARG